ncbi:hypothetical protein JTE90_014300 [Oedothorax gibbosus]|uniref:Acetoacetyl-CoA synthetase n=1 Tax=Oedothorax gibbosus TaxID=931172 RepID=A0AAV6UI99_9ARAC|nr:hypothetical protein JTE90_014300 [Oedothorax gibbosus]
MSNRVNENDVVLYPSIVYSPPEHKENQLVLFSKFVENKYNIKLKDYWELHEWSYKNYPEFWDCVWKYFNILHSQPYTQVIDRNSDFLNARWFEGVRLNYSANILKYRDSRTALIAIDDYDNVRYITYEELYDEVKVYIRALKGAGIQKEDVVACYMPNKIEAVFAFLATAAIGACLPSLEKVIFVPTEGKTEDISNVPKCILLSSFLEDTKRVLEDDSSDIEFEQVPFDHPLCISFTSGTTGAPKGLVHSVGMFLASLKDYGLMQDCTREDILFNISPAGWISWHMFVNTLHLGSTLVMYEGDIFEKSPDRYWEVFDKLGVTSSYIWSSTVENMQKSGHVPSSKHSLKTLRQIFPMGSPTKPICFNFLTEKVKKNIFCPSVYGCTEVFGLISGLDSNLHLYRGEMQAFSLGMDVRILDENDQPVIGKRGEVVIANPFPATFIRILNDDNQEMVKKNYLSQHPGYWSVCDDAWVNPVTKGLIVYGRSDETMNPYGNRFSCSEIYSALEGFPGIDDSVCVSQFNSSMDERVVLFVKMKDGCPLTEDIQNSIKVTIERHLTIEHVPALIVQAPDVPYNLTGKKLNGLVKNLINKNTIKNTEIVVNPASVDFYKTMDLGQF